MSYIKLCQIIDTETMGLNYIETAYLDENGNNIIVTNNLKSSSYPVQFTCEVIDWVSEEDFLNRGKINNFYSEDVTLNTKPSSIRASIYNNLILKYPELVE